MKESQKVGPLLDRTGRVAGVYIAFVRRLRGANAFPKKSGHSVMKRHEKCIVRKEIISGAENHGVVAIYCK